MHTDIFTYFTDTTGKSRLLYSAESWVHIRVRLETAGPVSIGTRESVSPVLSGKGILLTTGEDEKWILPKGDRVFIAAESVNRVKWSVQPIAYGDQFNVISQIRDAANRMIRAVTGLRKRSAPKAINPAKPPCPPALKPPFIP